MKLIPGWLVGCVDVKANLWIVFNIEKNMTILLNCFNSVLANLQSI